MENDPINQTANIKADLSKDIEETVLFLLPNTVIYSNRKMTRYTGKERRGYQSKHQPKGLEVR